MSSPPPPPPDRSRAGDHSLPQAWADKVEIIRVPRSRNRSLRARPLVAALSIGVGLALGLTLLVFLRWHDERRSDLVAQRGALDAFLGSAEFGAFTRQLDREIVAAINFASARPEEAQAAFPALAARAEARREIPWTHEILPLPIPVAAEPARVAAAVRAVGAVLARRGYVCDEADRTAARRLFLRCLAPHAETYLLRHPGRGFRALALDRAMQDMALAAFAGRHGPGFGLADTERFFSFYAAIGPRLWQAIGEEAAFGGRNPFSAPAGRS